MAIVRSRAFFVNKGPERCWSYVLSWDDRIQISRLDDSVRVVSRCDKAPVALFRGSGICAEHLAYQRQQEVRWSNN
jgi:hypothetical protein